MIGPPILKFRMKKFELAVDSDGVTFAAPSRAGLVSGTTVAVTAGEVAAASGAVPGAGGTAGATVVPGAAASGAPGAVVVAGAVVVPGAAGTAGDAPISAGEAAPGLVAGEAAGS